MKIVPADVRSKTNDGWSHNLDRGDLGSSRALPGEKAHRRPVTGRRPRWGSLIKAASVLSLTFCVCLACLLGAGGAMADSEPTLDFTQPKNVSQDPASADNNPRMAVSPSTGSTHLVWEKQGEVYYTDNLNLEFSPINLTLNMMLGTGEKRSRQFVVPPRSRQTFSINSMGIVGLFKYCDAVAMHLFGSYEDGWDNKGNRIPGWATVYSSLKNDMNNNWLSNHELVVSSCGWPHGDPPGEQFYNPVSPAGSDHTYQDQARAIGEVGIGGLFGAGCKKIWVYKDIDEWYAWDNYFGLFSYTTHEQFKEDGIVPTDAWGEYRKHQESDRLR